MGGSATLVRWVLRALLNFIKAGRGGAYEGVYYTVENLCHAVAVCIPDFRIDEAGASLCEDDALNCFA